MKKFALLLLVPLLLPSCGLQPVYGGAERGVVASELANIDVAPIEGKAGWLMRDALIGKLQSNGSARYRLEVRLDDDITGYGIRADDSVTRERRTLRARYRVVDIASGAILLDRSTGSDAGIDVVSSEYATIAAESTALENLVERVSDQIVVRLSLAARNGWADVAASN